jgi:hypothetical protein
MANGETEICPRCRSARVVAGRYVTQDWNGPSFKPSGTRIRFTVIETAGIAFGEEGWICVDCGLV